MFFSKIYRRKFSKSKRLKGRAPSDKEVKKIANFN